MQLALVSDIHSNYKALEAFLAYIEKRDVDGIICLGDYLTDCPYPQRTLGMLRNMMSEDIMPPQSEGERTSAKHTMPSKKYSCYMIRGNREQYLIDNFYKPQGWKPSSANGVLYYTSKQITEADIHFFESLPAARTLEMEGCPSMCICHGSPTDLRGNFLEEPKLKDEALRNLKEDYLFGGHSHHQEIYCKFGKTYVNPGSLGIAIDGVGRRAQFAMLRTVEDAKPVGEAIDSNSIGSEGVPATRKFCPERDTNTGAGINQRTKIKFEIELVSIPYDVDTLLQDFTSAGLDEYGMVLNRAVKKTLVTGVNYFYYAVVEAIKLTGKPLPEITEDIWQCVADKLEL